MDFFTKDKNILREVCATLTECGCCARCTLRFMGLKDMYTYRGDTQEMNELVKTYLTTMELLEEDTVMTKKSQETDKLNNEVKEETQSKVTDEVLTVQIDSNGKNENENNSNSSENTSNTNGSNEDSKMDTDQNFSPIPKMVDNNCEKDTVKLDTDSETANPQITDKIQTESSANVPCTVCLGILDEFTSDEFLNKIKDEAKGDGFVFTTYMCSLMIPVCVILREHAMMVHLKDKHETTYKSKKYTDVATVKDVWKWRNGPVLKDILDAPFDVKSPFDITLTFQYSHSDQECTFLLDSVSDTFRRRKQDRRHRKKSSFAQSLFNRANVAKAVDDMQEQEFRKNYQCPPVATTCKTLCDVKCQNEVIFVAGRYNKYSRTLSQTPWLIDGVRKSELSVEELLCAELNKHVKPTEQKFSSSGREDVDVMMLGNGRPFVLELINPCRRELTQKEMSQIQKDTNAATKDIRCTDLQIVTREETEMLKEGEIDKVKHYSALCWSKSPLTVEQLDVLTQTKELKLLQKTPIRVLHRRPLATRDRYIHSMSVDKVDDHHFRVTMATQAGTYIKEFVHGDFGRTKPNFGTLLGVDCDISQLDVTAIDLDWPKKILVDVD